MLIRMKLGREHHRRGRAGEDTRGQRTARATALAWLTPGKGRNGQVEALIVECRARVSSDGNEWPSGIDGPLRGGGPADGI